MRSTSFILHASDAAHIARLSEAHAAVLALFRENSNYEAMAQALSVPIGTVKSRLNRARAKIVELRAEAARAKEAA